MDKIDVRLVNLPPMRLASFYGFGAEPEEQALKKLKTWAEPRGYLDKPSQHRVFGFNNPDPLPGSPNYGYEFWITVGPEVEPEGEMRIRQFSGGSFAVLSLADPFADPYQMIPEGWKQLVKWVEDSSYQIDKQQYLEEHLLSESAPAGGWKMDLYLPVVE